MKKHTRQWFWFIGLYIVGVATVAVVSALLRCLIPH